MSAVTGSVEVREGSGYTVTVRMPWPFVDPTFRPEPGRQFRFALMVNYGDVLYAHRVGVVDFNRAEDFGNPNAWGIAKLVEP